jgi:hypothetical protein
MKWITSAAAAVSVVLLLSGCGNGEEEFKARTGTQQYDSAKEIADDLAAAGITCESFAQDASTEYSTDAGRCYVDGREIVLSTFASDSRQEENIASLAGTFEQIGLQYGFLVGSKWMINCGDTTATRMCSEMKMQLGGRIVKPNYA